MQIGVVSSPWLPVPPPSYGGTEAVVDVLARGLLARGHDVRVFTVGTSRVPAPRASFFLDGVTPMGATNPELAHVLAAYAELSDCEVIHDHTVLGPLVGRAVLEEVVRRGAPRPRIVATNHSTLDPVTLPIYAAISRRVP